jgi:hypothetical protein
MYGGISENPKRLSNQQAIIDWIVFYISSHQIVLSLPSLPYQSSFKCKLAFDFHVLRPLLLATLLIVRS